MGLMGQSFPVGAVVHARETLLDPPGHSHVPHDTAAHAPPYTADTGNTADERWLRSAPGGWRTETPRRILILDHTAMMGGGEIALLNLVTHLDRSRFEPVVALCSDGPLATELRERGIETHVLPLAASIVHTRKDSLSRSTLLRGRDALRLVGYVARLSAFIRRNRIALIHTNSLKADIIGGLAGRLASVPVVWHVRDRIADDYLRPKVVRAFRCLARVLPQRVVANSQATLATLRLRNVRRGHTVYSGIKMRNGTRADVRVVYDGLCKGRFEYAALDRGSDARIGGGSPWYQAFGRGARIGLVGRISPWKGQHIFLQAAARIREQFPRARFVIIGSALFEEHAYERELHEMVRTLGLEQCVEFAGFRKDVQAAIEELDILVHASTTGEPFGQVVVEGMAAGKPVIATNGGGVPEIVQDGDTGILVPMGDAEAMADALRSLMNDPAGALAMGTRGFERAADCFTIEQTARGIEAVYDSVLGSRSPRHEPISVTLPSPVD